MTGGAKNKKRSRWPKASLLLPVTGACLAGVCEATRSPAATLMAFYIDGGSGKGGEMVRAAADEGHPGFVDWSDPARAPFPDNSPSMFFIGRTYSGADGGEDFDIDDFAYFDQALSVEQLGYNKPAFAPPPQGTLFIIGE